MFSPLASQIGLLKMPDFDFEDFLENQGQHVNPESDNLHSEQDLLMEQILKNIHTTPIGLVLKKIASLPEVRKKKVLEIRQRITEGTYDLNECLDIALEKVLTDICEQ